MYVVTSDRNGPRRPTFGRFCVSVATCPREPVAYTSANLKAHNVSEAGSTSSLVGTIQPYHMGRWKKLISISRDWEQIHLPNVVHLSNNWRKKMFRNAHQFEVTVSLEIFKQTIKLYCMSYSVRHVAFWRWFSCGMLPCVVWQKFPTFQRCFYQGDVFWDVMVLMMEATSTSETSVNLYQTKHPEDGHLHTRRRHWNVTSVSAVSHVRFITL
jgi:hypothetical protein